jgi:hypothetical protein
VPSDLPTVNTIDSCTGRIISRRAHLRQIILSWLYLRARICREGSMMPPRRRSTRCSVDSAQQQQVRQQQKSRCGELWSCCVVFLCWTAENCGFLGAAAAAAFRRPEEPPSPATRSQLQAVRVHIEVPLSGMLALRGCRAVLLCQIAYMCCAVKRQRL